MSAHQSWTPATISALAAIFGSLTGALGSNFSTWIGQRHQDRRDLLEKKISQHEQLYSDFIGETAGLRCMQYRTIFRTLTSSYLFTQFWVAFG